MQDVTLLAGEVASQRRDDVTQHFGWPCIVLRADRATFVVVILVVYSNDPYGS
jgi:hypothetical protein